MGEFLTVWIGLLRGVNVGGNKMIAMAELRASLAGLGLRNPRTLLQSGNIVFESPRKHDALEKLLEAHTEKTFGLKTRYLLRSHAEWDAIAAGNPFAALAKSDPNRLLVFLLKDKAPSSAFKALEAAISGRETIHGAGRHLYATFPDGIARTKLTTALMDRHLGTACTGRNWNTVLKLAALAAV